MASNGRTVPRRSAAAASLAAILAGAIACNGPSAADPRLTRIAELEDKVQQQAAALTRKDEEIAAQARTIQELRGFSGARSIDQFVHVSRVEIERLSGGYDDDRDGIDDGVVAYLRLFDSEGDVIKASGSAVLEAYDLAAPEGRQLVAKLEADVAMMRSVWFGKLMTSHYTLKAPWLPDRRPRNSRITLVVRFTDLLSGNVFEAQHVADVKGATP
ncbi:MAG: hypothetical protein DCC65_14890 [Planctomycetota bacterium]|nr:MAG: hypothetical protein DCC65_14890 [Planctomycetota bacterium]